MTERIGSGEFDACEQGEEVVTGPAEFVEGWRTAPIFRSTQPQGPGTRDSGTEVPDITTSPN